MAKLLLCTSMYGFQSCVIYLFCRRSKTASYIQRNSPRIDITDIIMQIISLVSLLSAIYPEGGHDVDSSAKMGEESSPSYSGHHCRALYGTGWYWTTLNGNQGAPWRLMTLTFIWLKVWPWYKLRYRLWSVELKFTMGSELCTNTLIHKILSS